MRGQWPSGWEDPEDEELDTEEPDEETEVRLSEVAAFLATVPAPVLPGAIESRILAALAAESAARAADLTTDPVAGSPGTDRSRTLGPAPARARVRRFRGLRPAHVSGALAACLLFAGIGFAISLSNGASSSSGSAANAPQAADSASATGKGAKGYSASGPSYLPGSPAIVVIHSGTTYQGATLGGQVRSAIQALHANERTPAAPVPSASSSSAAPASSAPASSAAASSAAGSGSSPASVSNGSASTSVNVLRGCVLNLTGRTAPRLVDLASYQGMPAYVIATASHVWVVRLDCTAARPDVITSASLAS
jgi:cytoskeletal protein RodZ